MADRKKRTKREELREQRRRQQRNSRLLVFGIIGVIVLAFLAVVVVPPILEANQPIGAIVEITPHPRPQPDGKTAGNPAAPVRVDVYEDFQCPACARFSLEIEPQIMDEYVASGQVYYVYHHYPFLDDNSFTKESDQAANASMCAAEQDRFWDYHDMLYTNWNGENQGAFSDRRLTAFAETLDLNMDEFNECFENNEYEDMIDEDIASGRALGVDSTPSIFVNGQLVTPGRVPSFTDMQAAIDAAITQ